MKQLPPPLRMVDRTVVEYRRRRLAYFGGCDYYRLSTHPLVCDAARAVLEREGVGVAASRVTTGNHPLFEELEAWLVGFFGVPRALLVDAGYAANGIAAQALAGTVTHALLDERSHGSLVDAARFLDCPTQNFRHRDPADLRRQLAGLPRGARPLVLTDGLFGRDGAVAPVGEYLDLLPSRGRLLLDEAHAAGVMGTGGRGTLELCGVEDDRIVRTGTLSKAFGAFGGFILADKPLAERVVHRGTWFAASTPIPLPAAAAALAAGRLIAGDVAMRQRLRTHTLEVKTALAGVGVKTMANDAPLIAVFPASGAAATALRSACLRRGVYPTLIRYPGGPPGGYFRIALSSEHTPAQLSALVAVFAGIARLRGETRGTHSAANSTSGTSRTAGGTLKKSAGGI